MGTRVFSPLTAPAHGIRRWRSLRGRQTRGNRLPSIVLASRPASPTPVACSLHGCAGIASGVPSPAPLRPPALFLSRLSRISWLTEQRSVVPGNRHPPLAGKLANCTVKPLWFHYG